MYRSFRGKNSAAKIDEEENRLLLPHSVLRWQLAGNAVPHKAMVWWVTSTCSGLQIYIFHAEINFRVVLREVPIRSSWLCINNQLSSQVQFDIFNHGAPFKTFWIRACIRLDAVWTYSIWIKISFSFYHCAVALLKFTSS